MAPRPLRVSVKDEVATKEEDLSTKQEDLDLIVAPEGADVKLKDIISLWTTNIMQMYGEADSVDGAPVAEGSLEDLAGEAPLFIALESYFKQTGSIYKLAFGPKAFIVVSDALAAKEILKTKATSFDKGVLAEILEPIMGKGLIPADLETWKIRRRAIVPGFHQKWLQAMCHLFTDCNQRLCDKLDKIAEKGEVVEMEAEFCSVALDIIGKSVFNYDFGSVANESPVIKAVYNTLREAEHRSTFYFPYWNIPGASMVVPRQRRFQADLKVINDVLTKLIREAQSSREAADVEDLQDIDYTASSDPSLLRFLVDLRGEETTNKQLRDDLMTMLVAGHETTAAVLTWSAYLLATHPDTMAEVQAEVDEVLGQTPGRPSFDDIKKLQKVRHVIAESLRLYPEPPILIRRALEKVELPQGGTDKKITLLPGADVFIAVWNLHRSPDLWDNPEKFDISRWTKPFTNDKLGGWAGYNPELQQGLYPTETATDFAYIPFGGGIRKCVGDQFAVMESTVVLSMLLQRFSFQLACAPEAVGMVTGATIHTKGGLPMRILKRK